MQVGLRYSIQLLFIQNVCHCQTVVVESNVKLFLSHQTLCGLHHNVPLQSDCMNNQEQSLNQVYVTKPSQELEIQLAISRQN